MGKLLAAAVAGVALLVYAFHSHGATVTRSTFFDEAFGLTADDQQRLPEHLKKDFDEAEKHLYDVSLGPDSGLLMDTKRAHQEAHLVSAAAAAGLDITPQGRGKVVMIWYGGPTAASRSTLERCL